MIILETTFLLLADEPDAISTMPFVTISDNLVLQILDQNIIPVTDLLKEKDLGLNSNNSDSMSVFENSKTSDNGLVFIEYNPVVEGIATNQSEFGVEKSSELGELQKAHSAARVRANHPKSA